MWFNSVPHVHDIYCFSLSAVLYVLVLLFLTASVIMGIESSNPADYNTSDPWDMARLFCEAVVMFMVATTIIQEIFEAVK